MKRFAATAISPRYYVSLRVQKVDVEKRVIYGLSVATLGPAEGHGESLDAETLRQIVAAGNARPIRCRMNHPDEDADGNTPVSKELEALVGYATNFRIEGDKVLADCKILSKTAAPKGDQILALAAEAPEVFGTSMVFTGKAEKGKTRISELYSIDFVDVPAANPAGLFSAKTKGVKKMVRGFMEGGKCYTEVDGEKHDFVLPEGYEIKKVEAVDEKKADEKKEDAKAQEDKTAEAKAAAAKVEGKTFEDGIKSEREYAEQFATALDAGGITGEAAKTFRKDFYGRRIEDVKFLASNHIGARAKAVGESASAGAAETEEQKIEAAAVKRFNADKRVRSSFSPKLAHNDNPESDEYKAELKRFVAREKKFAEDLKKPAVTGEA